MRPVSATFLKMLTQRHRRVSRITALDSSMQPIAVLSGESGYAVEGSVTIDRRRAVRRTCTLSLANPDGVWTPDDPTDFFFFGNLIKIERGIYLSEDQIEWCVLGVFVIDSPTAELDGTRSFLQVQGQDRLKRAVYSKFAAPTLYAAGTRIRDVIADMELDAGMGSDLYRLDDAGKVLAADRVYDSQEERVAAMMDLARDYAFDLFVDADGVLVLELARTITELATSWAFTAGEEAVMLGVTKSLSDQRFYNHVVVTGENADMVPAGPVRGEASDLNPASPGYVFGPLGDRTYFYSSALITTVAQANAVAAAMLQEVGLIEEELSLPIVVNPALEAGDAISIVEPTTKTDSRYLIDSITIPLGAGTSRIQAKQVRSLT